jgi:hypothetical protein
VLASAQRRHARVIERRRRQERRMERDEGIGFGGRAGIFFLARYIFRVRSRLAVRPTRRNEGVPPIRWNRRIRHIERIFVFREPLRSIPLAQPNIGTSLRCRTIPLHSTWFHEPNTPLEQNNIF